ncbi:hypothetical protein cypCar_00029887 [Cyprinus carpio]|nr:hypothetical protein cypCar_00029887 [Cyprinus carpio]
MSSNFLCALLVLAFLGSGKSNSGVSIRHGRYGDGQDITCVLSGDENMTQINWEMLRGPHRTKLGTYHPRFGIYIMQEYKPKVKIQNKQTPYPSSSLLIKVASNESVQICCAFITFPSGKLEQCIDISKKDVSINTSMIKDFTYEEPEPRLGLFGHLGAMIIGTILSLFILTILFYLCRKTSCRRHLLKNQLMYQLLKILQMALTAQNFMPRSKKTFYTAGCGSLTKANPNHGHKVALESGLLVDGGETVIAEGLRVCPKERGWGLSGVILRFVDGYIKKVYPNVKTKRLTRGDDPGPEKLRKFTLLARRVS